MTPEQLTEALKQRCPESLKSVVLYGSAAAGDFVEKKSDYNILVITENLNIQTLKAFSDTAAKWAQAGNPPPLLFTQERLAQATDVFPIELLDIRECHKVIYGPNLVKNLPIETANLRLQIEHELRGKLIQLRQRYLLTKAKEKAVIRLMAESLSTFLVLFRAALRLFEDQVPQPKTAALNKLATHLNFDPEIFHTLLQIKAGSLAPKSIQAEHLFNTYLQTIERIIDAVDAYIQKGEKS